MTTESQAQAQGPKTIDIITYAGVISMDGYESVCEVLRQKRSDRAILVLSTPGGDPHAGFRIARALQHAYGEFEALVPRYCKSAGTLVLIGAKRLYLDDMSELGPLDVQVKKSDEVVGRSSGLDIFQAVSYLQGQAMAGFRSYLNDLTQEVGLSTKIASEISTKLAVGMLDPISAQIDPMKLAEMQRATEIAFAYGNRLNEKSGNLRAGGIAKLVTGYPSHGFVIDRKEAKGIFTDVARPDGVLSQLSEAFRAAMMADINSASPKVKILTGPDPAAQPADQSGEADATATAPDAEPGPRSDQGSESTVNGDREADAGQQAPAADQHTARAFLPERWAANETR
jgi:hypothetical protein